MKTNSETNKYKIAISQGDINGIGYEILFKTFSNNDLFEICTPIVYGDSKIADIHRKKLNIDINYKTIKHPQEATPGVLNIISCLPSDYVVEFGKATLEAGEAAFWALETATQHLKQGLVDVLVTCPINKYSIQNDNFSFQGHTEYLEDRLGSAHGSLMILQNHMMRVALATTHLPLGEVPKAITPELIELRIRQLQYSLCHDFLISMPKIAVLSLNPHVGDNGLLGSEEEKIIKPTIAKLIEEGKHIFGPFSTDGFFGSHLYHQFDGILAMYHDQGLAPFKALSMNDGINFTAGLDFVRTSPDHGTAYDIAGKGIASEESFRNAIYSAIDIQRRRIFDKESSMHPLNKLYNERKEDFNKSHKRN